MTWCFCSYCFKPSLCFAVSKSENCDGLEGPWKCSWADHFKTVLISYLLYCPHSNSLSFTRSFHFSNLDYVRRSLQSVALSCWFILPCLKSTINLMLYLSTIILILFQRYHYLAFCSWWWPINHFHYLILHWYSRSMCSYHLWIHLDYLSG